MHRMVNIIHDFTVTDRRKNPLEELIFSWIAHALSEISEKMILPTNFFEVYPKHDF